jgi:hypothetical protein
MRPTTPSPDDHPTWLPRKGLLIQSGPIHNTWLLLISFGASATCPRVSAHAHAQFAPPARPSLSQDLTSATRAPRGMQYPAYSAVGSDPALAWPMCECRPYADGIRDSFSRAHSVRAGFSPAQAGRCGLYSAGMGFATGRGARTYRTTRGRCVGRCVGSSVEAWPVRPVEPSGSGTRRAGRGAVLVAGVGG